MLPIEKIKQGICSYFGTDTKRIHHALKVHSYSSLIATLEDLNDQDKNLLEAAALLHDIGIKEAERKYHSSAGNYQEIEGPAIAKDLLSPYDVPQEILERILFLIGHHHTYSAIDTLDFQILIESDFFVNAVEDNLSQEAIATSYQKYFKTQTGRSLLESAFLSK